MNTRDLQQEELLDEVTRLGMAMYEDKLRPTLESSSLGRMVAIHPDSADYAVAGDSAEAMRLLRTRQPNGLFFVRRIGPPTTGDNRLAARFTSAELKRK